MKNAYPRKLVRRAPFDAILAALSLAMMASATAVPLPTDIAQTPLIVTSSAKAKPNIMLLMDNSGSMGRTHMPDEAESVMGVKSIGYKSPQCNALYYNPAGTYLLPKKYDGTFFAVPTFGAAPYSGYGTFFTPQDTSVVDLSTGFSPYEYSAGRQTVFGPLIAPTTGPSAGFAAPSVGAAFYYAYSGPETLKYDSAPCNQLDTGVSTSTPGGGYWTRVDVNATGTAAQKSHFALWYSFYRTRLGLTKSAASLAFSPLDASKRVGFITVEPKVDRNDTLIAADRYLQIGDFSTVAAGQKEQWYQKLFSQVPSGASPTREGLARVGRYYAGKTDSINGGMGGPDPVQFACQQNFTILTTDGYWNAQTETPGGGGLNKDATGLVGQQDGRPFCNVTDPYCVRPMFDGNSADIQLVTDKYNTYTNFTCPLDAIYRRTEQQQRKVFNVTRDTTRTLQRTVQYKRSSSQLVAKSEQTIKTTKQTTKTVDQYYVEKNTPVQDRYQVWMSQDRIVRDTEQYQRQTRQQTAQTLQNTEVITQTVAHNERWQTSSTQYGIVTTQFRTSTSNFKEGKEQVYKRQWQWIGTNNLGETSAPLPSATCPAGYTCVQYDSFPNQLVDPASCPLTPSPSTVTGPNSDLTQSYLHTDCTPGPQNSAYVPVAACTSGVTPGTPRAATSGNSWVKITCDRVDSTPDFANGRTVATCPASSQMGGTPFTITYCTVVQNSTTWQTTACTPSGPSTGGYPYITTECIRPGATNYAATNSAPCNELAGPQTDATTKVTTVCTKTLDTTVAAPPAGAGCNNNPGTTTPFLKVTCGVNPVSSTIKSITSCNPGTDASWNKTVCNQVAVAPMATATAVQWMTCSAGPNAGAYAYDTVCDTTGVNNQTAFVAASTCGNATSTTLATGAPWIDVICTTPPGPANQQPAYPWDPSLGTCPSDPGTSPPFARSTCTTVPVSAAVPVDETTCTATTSSTTSPFVTTRCVKQGLAGTFTCPGTTPTAFPWIYERCGFAPTSYRNVAYGSCTPGSSAGLAADEVCRESITPSFVATGTCVPDLTPSGTNPKVTCSGAVVVAALSGPTDPASCPAVPGPQGGTNQYDVTCATSPYGAYAVEKGVSACPTPAMDPVTFEVTTCRNPPATNFVMVNSGPCTVTGSPIPGDGSNDWTTTQCFVSDNSVDMQGSVCAGTVVTQSGTGPAITCVANGGATAQPVNLASCAGVVGTSDATAPYDTVTACNSTETTQPWNDFGGSLCTPGAGSVVGERYDCRRVQVGTDVLDATCLSPSGPDATGLITSCPHVTGTGYKYKVSTTTTKVRTPMSGGAPSGVPVSIPVSGSPTTPVDVGAACYASAQATPSLPDFPARPPVTIAGCTAWPCTETTLSAGGSVNSLADVAQYYYTTDLRPTMANVVKSAGTTGAEEDTATHQHMTTFVVALGVNGTLAYRPDYYTATTGDFNSIRYGLGVDWPVWPDPNLTYTNVDEYNNPKSIDDFWHTAVNGRGRFFSANNPTTVIDGLADALAKVDTISAAGAPDAISSLTPTSTNNFVYGSSYESGTWIGDLEAFTINSVTGVLNVPRVWSAKTLLDARTFQTCDNRNIFLMRGSSLVDFAWDTVKCDTAGTVTTTVAGTPMNTAEKANFSAANISLLSQFTAYLPTDPQLLAAQAPGAIVNYLRGQRGSEGFVAGSTTKFFRKRTFVLGDLVDSQPVYVKQPFADYTENNYQVFKTNNATRASMVYVGGNDGMLHAFTAVVDATGGQEAWAVIPSAVLPYMYQLADKNYDRNHRFFVDGTPVASDVYDGTNWHTILVAGLNAGGKGYYAVDITNPASPVGLWEFKQDNAVCSAPAPATIPLGTKSDCNLGLSFGKPVISKIGTRWVAMFTSGYNNLNGVSRDGEGFLYVVDAMSGDLLQKIGTGAGDGTTPSGLAQINNYVDNVLANNATLRAYGGDLLGNIWRFDFAPTPQATLVGTAKSGTTPQPITTRPELAELNGEPFVLVGTGKLLGETDVPPSGVQSVYGIRDKLTAVPAGSPPAIYSSLRGSLRGMTMTQVGPPTPNPPVRTIACTTNCAKTDGWVVDLAESGERVNVDMKLVLGTLVFASNVPMDIPCSIGGHSWLNQLDFRTGQAVTTAPLSGSDGVISNYLADSLNLGFNVIQRERAPGNNNAGGFQTNSRQGDGSRPVNDNYIAPPPFVGKRISWREIVQ